MSRLPFDNSLPPWHRSALGANTFDSTTGLPTPTIYEQTTALALQHNATNLGQGFPDEDGPQWLLNLAAEAIRSPQSGPTNQYAPGLGLMPLRESIAEHIEQFQDVTLDPTRSVMVTAGATEAIAATVLALAKPGHEVLTFEPHYDSYGAMVALAGAELVGVPLRGEDFRPDLLAFENALTDKTSLILLNTPHNPTGAVFTPDELTVIVNLARARNIPIMSDEVYDHLVLPSAETTHRSILTIPGAEEIAVAIGSAGKSFSVTGWKIGWILGRPETISRIRGVKQFLTFSSSPAYQWAVADALKDDRGFFAQNTSLLQEKQELLHDGLTNLGFIVNKPQAGYFLLADISPLTDIQDTEFTQRLAAEVGVAGIPVSSLTIKSESQVPSPDNSHTSHSDDASGSVHAHNFNRLVRFAFCKNSLSIETSLENMEKRLSRIL